EAGGDGGRGAPISAKIHAMRALALVALAVVSCADSAPAAPAAAESALEPVRAKYDLPSLAGAVFSGDATIAVGAVGVRKRGDPTPITRADRWHLGSDTKAMTATLIALSGGGGRAGGEPQVGRRPPQGRGGLRPAPRGGGGGPAPPSGGGRPGGGPGALGARGGAPGPPAGAAPPRRAGHAATPARDASW